MLHLVPRSKLDAANRELALAEARVDDFERLRQADAEAIAYLQSETASLRAHLAKAERTRDGEAKRAAYYLRLLTERDQCVVCGRLLQVPRMPPCDDHHEPRVTGQHWRDWARVAEAIEQIAEKGKTS
jgi:hypothetical protein